MSTRTEGKLAETPLWRHPQVVSALIMALVGGLAGVLGALITARAIPVELLLNNLRLRAPIEAVGSGTVLNYMLRSCPNVFKGRPSVITRPCGTFPGASTFSDASHGAEVESVPLLLMASATLEEANFVRLEGECYFEVALGLEPVQVAFGAKTKQEFDHTFGKLAAQIHLDPDTKAPSMTIADLYDWVRRTTPRWHSMRARGGYQVFSTNAPHSATRALVDSQLDCVRPEPSYWPRDLRKWDLEASTLRSQTTPWIAVGNPDSAAILAKMQSEGRALLLTLSRTPGMSLRRPLYLYGRLCPRLDARRRVRYVADVRISRFVKRVLNDLESCSMPSVRIRDQLAALHLNGYGEEIWLTDEDSRDNVIYGYFRRPTGNQLAMR